MGGGGRVVDDIRETEAWRRASARGKRFVEGVAKGFLGRARAHWGGAKPPAALLIPTAVRRCAMCGRDFSETEEWPLGLHPCACLDEWHWVCYDCVRSFEMVRSEPAPAYDDVYPLLRFAFRDYFGLLAACPADLRDAIAVAGALMAGGA